MSKYNGATKKKREEREAKQKNGLQAFLGQLTGVQQKFINEWKDKFNSLGSQVDAIFKIATTEVGRLWANQQKMVESIDHIDVNTLAIAELHKVVFNRLVKYEALFKTLCDLAEIKVPEGEELAALNKAGEELYVEKTKEAFAAILERRKKEDEERKAAAEKAEAEAKAAAEAKTEAERAEAALREAERPQTIEEVTGGGKGVEIPEGAQVFGGA